jgi:two-component system sensor histidine kinase VicK
MNLRKDVIFLEFLILVNRNTKNLVYIYTIMLKDLSIPDITKSETTQVMYGNENVTKFSVNGLSTVKHSLDVCGDSSMPAVIINSEPVKNAYHDLHFRGVRIRWITDIIKDNIIYCREVMKIAELRHLDGLKGGFVISDGKNYIATAVLQEEEPVTQLIYSNVEAITQFQQYVFNTL